MENKTVGLCIQYDGIDNYGTVLQALATLKVVQNLGYDARLISYRRKYTPIYILKQIPRIFDYSSIKGYRRNQERKKNLKRSEKFRYNMSLKSLRFREFRENYFDTQLIDVYYGYKELSTQSNNYSAFIVGSDQLWLPAGLKTNFYNLNFVKDAINKISYSTSFGVSSIPHNQIKETRKYLERINFLSVREAAGAKIVKDLTGRDAYVACDPVMLFPREDWEKLLENVSMPPEINEKSYVLTYYLGGSAIARSIAKQIADQYGLMLVPIKFVEDYYSIDEDYGDVSPFGLTPLQFVKLIKNAQYIFTDSFHGTAFSIIFEKQFISTYRFDSKDRLSKNSRIDNILSKFDLSNRLYTSAKDIFQLIRNEIDYSIVNLKREEWRNESLDFLKKALGGE